MADEPQTPFPDVRAVGTVLAEMAALADECRSVTDEDRIGHIYERALRLVLELRVPRMPDDPADLKAMLDECQRDDAVGMSTEQVFEELDRQRRTFTSFLEDYRRVVAGGRWTTASTMLSSRFPTRRHHDDVAAVAIVTRDTVSDDGRRRGLDRLADLLREHVTEK